MSECCRAVVHVVNRGLSQRRSCALIGVARSALGYESVMAAEDAPAVSAMQALAAQYPRYGYRRRSFLRREGHAMSVGGLARLWQQSALQVPRKRPRRWMATRSGRPQPPTLRNHVWAYDFVFDACADGQQLQCLTIIDKYTQECLAIDVAGAIRSRRVIDVLAKLITVHGAPCYLRSDNGPQFVSRAILDRIVTSGINTATSDPGKPWQNGTNESFNGKLRDEGLSMEWLRSREDAKAVIETWRRHCNAVGPHSSLGYQTPNAFKATLKQSTQLGASL
jgi:putative transposase